jgi:hypothetical protein
MKIVCNMENYMKMVQNIFFIFMINDNDADILYGDQILNMSKQSQVS